MLNISYKVTVKSIKPFFKKVEKRKQVPHQEQQQLQQQQSGVSYRAATKVAAKKASEIHRTVHAMHTSLEAQ